MVGFRRYCPACGKLPAILLVIHIKNILKLLTEDGYAGMSRRRWGAVCMTHLRSMYKTYSGGCNLISSPQINDVLQRLALLVALQVAAENVKPPRKFVPDTAAGVLG